MSPDEVKQARSKLQCTARELAAVLELPPATISAWERGEQFPTKQHVDRIQKLLAEGPKSIPKRAKGADPLDALRDPEVWELIRKLLSHPKLRAEVAKLASKYDDV